MLTESADLRHVVIDFLDAVDWQRLDDAVLARDDLDGKPGELTRGCCRSFGNGPSVLDQLEIARFAEKHLMPDRVAITRGGGEEALDPETGAA